MQLLKEIYHDDIGLENSSEVVKYEIRKASRAVLINEINKIAILYVSKDGYYKLPGGGIEKNETVEEALRREVYEEVGSDIEVINKIGIIIEYREAYEQLQISYNYTCKTRDELISPKFTQIELEHGFELKWMTIDDAIRAIESYKGHKYLAKFISLRDLIILREANNKINFIKDSLKV